MKTLLITLSLLTSLTIIQAQSTIYGVEWDPITNVSYLSSISPADGNILRISVLPGVANEFTARGTAILNLNNKLYSFATYTNNTTTISKLYNVNINDGSITSNPFLSSPVRELNYDAVSGNYYAIEFEDTTAAPTGGMTSVNDFGDTTTAYVGASVISGIYYTVSVNVSTGVVTRIASIAGVTGISANNSTYNASTGQFIFVDDNDVIYTINVSDGSITSSATLSTSVQELHMNPLTGVYSALAFNNGTYNLVTVNTSNGTVTTIGAVTGLNSIKICTSTLDKLNDVFTVTDSNDELFNINLNTGARISKQPLSNEVIGLTIDPAIPVPVISNAYMTNPNNPRPNDPIPIGGFERVKSQYTKEQLNKEILAYPNPALDQITIEAPKSTRLSIYDIAGVLVKEVVLKNELTTVNIEELKNGVHFFNLSSNGKTETKRIIVH